MDTLRLLLAGDVMTGRGIDQVLPHPGDPRLHESWMRDAREYVRLAERANGPVPAPVGPEYIWGDALAVMERLAPALRIVNLETAITATGQPWPDKGIHYRMHPANMACLRAAGLDACALANNHVLDWGLEGLHETLATLEAAGVQIAGAGRDRAQAWTPAVLPLADGRRLLLFSFATESSGVPREWAARSNRPGVALLPGLGTRTAQTIARRVEAHRKPGDRVVVSIHWGGNWGLDIPPAHQAFARELIDLGAADVVHGHSSHHPLPVEVWHGRAILYGCGDLLNDYEGIGAHGHLRCDVGCLYVLTLDEAGNLHELEVEPLQLRRLRLGKADAMARSWLLSVFNEGGRALGTRMQSMADGSFAMCWK
ncbi:CapA family protein [Ramlibacter henchirensis]|uniref:CapA family protein n=1 Tax=Ramlibacter henchirensis TaxID=204072 RepID=A0A4Z0C5I3_9BURK|nr:CapA family protein [Ramlibacter henchirensis]TFZ06162.1 CapA family protein [Ramlibacter henchirensis]